METYSIKLLAQLTLMPAEELRTASSHGLPSSPDQVSEIHNEEAQVQILSSIWWIWVSNQEICEIEKSGA